MNNKQFLQIGLLFVIAIVLISFAVNFDKLFRRWFGNDGPVDYDDTPLPQGDIDPNFDTRPYVARLQEVLQVMLDSSPRCDAYYALLQLGDVEFVMVCNAYKNELGRTLRSDMDSMVYDGCNVFWNRYGVQVRRRMNRLNVIG